MRRLERNGGHYVAGGARPGIVPGGDARGRDLIDALRSTLRDEYADASEQELQEALTNVVDAMSAAEAFNFGSALDRISKSANRVLSDPTFVSVAGTALPIVGGLAGTVV